MDLLTLLLACEVWVTFAYTLYRKDFFAGQISSWYIASIMLAGIGTFLTLCAFDLVYTGFDVESFMQIKLILAQVMTATCGAYSYIISRPVY